ncbi:MAG: hypothetical protein E7009_01870 [Alphaproteobacteria bacterium]|nr:hypothetical protein [Alphaproteobacteria bacterium]
MDLFCRAYMRACPTVPIRHSQMLVLEILCTTPGPHTPMMLADLGYVSRVVSPDDGRSVIILPTKRGRKLYSEYITANQRFLSDLSQKMGIKKFESLIKLISLANKYLAE